jgi:hypothetical protein
MTMHSAMVSTTLRFSSVNVGAILHKSVTLTLDVHDAATVKHAVQHR